MSTLFDNRTPFDLNTKWQEKLEEIVAESLLLEKFTLPYEVSISFVTNAEIKSLNKQYRQIDKETDVLSFPLWTWQEGENRTERNENGELLLGDIVISIEKASSQAEAYGHSLKRELCFLTAHSMLHLLGYDHMDPSEEQEMFQKQEMILQKAGVPRES